MDETDNAYPSFLSPTSKRGLPSSQFFGNQAISPGVSQTPTPPAKEEASSPAFSPFVRFQDDPVEELLPPPRLTSHNEGALDGVLPENFLVPLTKDDNPHDPVQPSFRVLLQSVDSPNRPPETIMDIDRRYSISQGSSEDSLRASMRASTMRAPAPLLRRFTSRVLKEEVSLFQLVPFHRRLIYVVWWSVCVCCFWTVITSDIGTFHFDSESGLVKSQLSVVTTWSTSKMFWKGGGQVIAVLYFQGVYITPWIQLIINLVVMFTPMYAARRRFILVRQRFLAKLSIMPTFMMLVNLEAFDNHVTTLIPARMYINPTRTYFIQMVAGPLLILLHNYVLDLNRLGPLPRTNILISRMSLFCSGCSLVCAVGFLSSNMLNIEITGLLGSLLDSDEKVKEMFLPKLLLEMPTHYGLDTFSKIVITSYFTLIMAVLPALAIFAECLWRIGAGVHADDVSLAIENGINPKEFGDIFGPLHVFRKFVQMFYTYDIFCLALFFAWLEIESVAEYIQRTLFPSVCEQYPDTFKCFGMNPTMPLTFVWLIAHVVTYYISSGLPMIWRMKILAKYVLTLKMLCCQWDVDEDIDSLDAEFIHGHTAHATEDEEIFDRWARLGGESVSGTIRGGTMRGGTVRDFYQNFSPRSWHGPAFSPSKKGSFKFAPKSGPII